MPVFMNDQQMWEHNAQGGRPTMENRLNKYYYGQNRLDHAYHAYYLAVDVDPELTRLRGEVERLEKEHRVRDLSFQELTKVINTLSTRLELAEARGDQWKTGAINSDENGALLAEKLETAEAQLDELQARKPLSVDEIADIVYENREIMWVNSLRTARAIHKSIYGGVE